MISETKGEGRFWATFAFALIIVIGIVSRSPEPSPKDASTPVDEFSAARARDALTSILAGGAPHPTGSAENDRVEERIVGALEALGYTPAIEQSLVCTERGTCAIVRNVVADLPGRLGGPAIMLNAHYDSVPAGPGAGDDGAGLASLLEIARALKKAPPPERPIRFLVDDGEELGLLGAEAWVRQHANEETLAVIVLEARGSSGPVLMFETNEGNLELVRSFAKAVPDPATSSVFFSVYQRLPNLTNFTVFKARGYEGMALAFIEDPAQYHTPLNDLAHLSDASVQHMGDVTSSMARQLAANGLAASDENASYFDVLGSTVVLWPESWNLWLAIAALVLVALLGIVALKSERATAPQILAGWFLVLGVVIATGGIGWGLSRLAMVRCGDTAWTANAGWLVLAAWLAAAAGMTIPFSLAKRPPSLLSIWTSVWLLFGILGVVVARLLPGAAYLFFLPAMVAGLSGMVSLLGRRSERNEGMIIVPFCVALLVAVPIIGGLYDGLGLIALPVVAALAALQLSTLLIASTGARRHALVAMACAVGALVCVVAFLLTPVYSATVPRAMNIVSVDDPRQPEASVVLLGSTDPLPEAIAKSGEWARNPVDALRRTPGSEAPRVWSTSTGPPEGPYPDLGSSTAEVVDGVRVLHLHVKPVSGEAVVRVRFPEGAAPHELAYGGEAFTFPDRSSHWLTLKGVPLEGAEIRASVPDGSMVEVLEERPGFAARAGAASIRAELAVPIGPGDRAVYVSRVAVDDLPASLPPDLAGLGATP